MASFPDLQWTFDWTTLHVGLFKSPTTGWVLRGRPNAAPEDGWVVAHDVFHHTPDDTGTYAEEVSTFGAEFWFSVGEPEGRVATKLVDSWHGVMCLTIEQGTKGVAGLRLPPTPEDEALNLTHPQADFFGSIYRRALEQARSDFHDFAEPALWDRLAADSMADRAIAWALRGLEWARSQWPDPVAAQLWFDAVQKAAGPGSPGEVLAVRIRGGELSLVRHTPMPNEQPHIQPHRTQRSSPSP